ncbi:MAG: tetratricopeptide repeat protein, partial [Myxococcales bacterium]|nr:tetratricopeptide repeat protein [Myxococcales bacterium]
AADGWPLLREGIDRVVADWSAARGRLCTEAEVDRTRPRDEADEGRRCLDEQAEVLVGFLGALERVEGQDLDRAFTVLGQLTPAGVCLDAGLLAQRPALPEDERERERAASLRAAIARYDGEFLGDAGLDGAKALLAEAEELGYPPLIAEAAMRVSRASLRSGDFTAAASHGERAFLLAGGQANDALAIDAAAMLGQIAYEQAEHETGARWVAIGRMLAERSPVELSFPEIHLAQSSAAVALGRGALAEAHDGYLETLAGYRRWLPAEHVEIGKVLMGDCIAESKRGRQEQAEQACKQGLAIIDRSLPRLHANRALALNNAAVMYLDAGEVEPALPLLRECLEIYVATRGADHPDVGLAHHNIGIALLDGGHPADSLPEFEAALANWSERLREDHPMFAYPLTGKGRALVELGRSAEAVAPLRRALALRGGEDVLPADLGETQFALARALAADEGTSEEVRSLAEAAAANYRRADGEEEAAKVESWLAEQPGQG